MKLGIVHYHLSHGGVGEVIRIVSRELTRRNIVHVVFTDYPVLEQEGIPWRHVPGLGYRDNGDDVALKDDLVACARDVLGARPDAWWIHNHSLGKNPALARVVASMARDGEAMLLHLHDLAEDGRPQNAAAFRQCSQPYPISPRIRYLFCNDRDRADFIACGTPEKGAAVLRNPLTPDESRTSSGSGTARVFAPIRGIRRKNLGEILLLSRFAPSDASWTISRRPENPREQVCHDSWAHVSSELKLPVIFDASSTEPFEELAHKATHFLTTSVAEGFGRCFLEGCAKGRLLIGRDLPHLTQELRTHGVDPGILYQKILVPLALLPGALWKEYGRQARMLRDLAWGRIPESINQNDPDYVDFANLSEALQLDVILRSADDPVRSAIMVQHHDITAPLADWLKDVLTRRAPIPSAELLKPWSVEIVVDQLLMHACEVMNGTDHSFHTLDPELVLERYSKRFQILQAPSLHDRTEIDVTRFSAIIFDLYGTLLGGNARGVSHDPSSDPALKDLIESFGIHPPDSPSLAITRQVQLEHAGSLERYPEVDLRESWRTVLNLGSEHDMTTLVEALQQVWMPVCLMDGAAEWLDRLSALPIRLGILSNAQCDALVRLGRHAEHFTPELTMLSYQFGYAKPTPKLFEILRRRLADWSVRPEQVLFVGNDPLHDIRPARHVGFQTALYAAQHSNPSPSVSFADFRILDWRRVPMPCFHVGNVRD